MKKVLILLAAALTVSTAATAQGFSLDKAGIEKKMAASDEDIQDARRGARANTWVNRGHTYFNAVTAPTGPLYRNMGAQELGLLVGQPSEKKQEAARGATYEVWVYPDFDLYLANNQVVFWKQKTVIAPNGMDVAFEAYTKAAELDARQAEPMKAGIEKLINQYRQFGDNDFTGGDYAAATQDFAKAYELSVSPLVNSPDTLSVFNAGYIATLNENFDDAVKYLNQAKALGYDNGGETYFFLYHALMGKQDEAAAEATLREGLLKFPGNTQLIESLIAFYTTTGQDASQVIPMVEETIAKDPQNHTLHFGLGLIYNRLEDYSQAAAAFKKAADLNPQDYASVFNLGITYLRQADAMTEEINAIPFNDRELYNQKMGEFNALYKQAIPYLEQAHALNPEDRTTVEMLRSIYFRFRDEGPEMTANYEKFNALLQAMPAAE